MTPPTEELTRLLTGAADDIVERDRVPGPDAPVLWRRGRRSHLGRRGPRRPALAALVLLLVLGRWWCCWPASPRPCRPAGGTLTYPRVVSDLIAGHRTSRATAPSSAGRHRRAERSPRTAA